MRYPGVMLAICLAAGGLNLSPDASAQDCLRYEYFLHRVGVADHWSRALDVAVAGDHAFVVTRWPEGLAVLGISPTGWPTLAGSVVLGANPLDVAVADDLAVVAGGAGGLHVIDVADPAAPHLLATVIEGGAPAVQEVALAGRYAYAVDSNLGLLVVDVGDPAAPVVAGSLDPAGTHWGVTVHGARAYLASDYSGVHVVDVTNPAAPVLLGTADTPGQAYSVAVAGTTVVVADRWNLQVVDASDPETPTIVGSVPVAGWAYDVTLTGVTALLAAQDGGFLVIDISDPTAPLVKSVNPTWNEAFGIAAADGRVYVADRYSGLLVYSLGNGVRALPHSDFALPDEATELVIRDDLAFVAAHCEDLVVVDLDGLVSPQIIGGFDYPGTCSENIVLSATHAYLDKDPSLLTLDITDPANPAWGSQESIEPSSFKDMAVSGSFLFITHGSDGMSIMNLVDPDHPSQQVLWTLTGWSLGAIEVAGNTAFISAGDGLLVLDITVPTYPMVVASLPSEGFGDIHLADGLICTAHFLHGFQTIDVSIPASPQLLATLPLPGQLDRVMRVGDYAYVCNYISSGPGEVHIVDVSDPTAPFLVGNVLLPFVGSGLAAYGDYVCIADGEGGLQFIQQQCAGVTATPEEAPDSPAVPALTGVQPNPFNPLTTVTFELSRRQDVNVSVYDLRGRPVRLLISGSHAAGRHRVTWNGRDESDREVASGTYIVRLETESDVDERKMMLIR